MGSLTFGVFNFLILLIGTLYMTKSCIQFLQKKVFDILYKIADLPILSTYKLKIYVSYRTLLSISPLMDDFRNMP